MYKILKKTILSENVIEYVFEAKLVAKSCLEGQFIILRIDDNGERVPFTITDYDREKGTITLLIQSIGYTTKKLALLNEGDSVLDFVGPLGLPSDFDSYDNILLVGGGIGVAVIYPEAKKLYKQGKSVTSIIGARNVSLFNYVDKLKASSTQLYAVTDDGSSGKKGFVTDVIKELLETQTFEVAFAVGPVRMMQAVSNLTKQYNLKTIVSLNPIMVDGTGMCGCCRVTVGDNVKYACVDGPNFDGHLVDFDELVNRNNFYKEIEQDHVCRLDKLTGFIKK